MSGDNIEGLEDFENLDVFDGLGEDPAFTEGLPPYTELGRIGLGPELQSEGMHKVREKFEEKAGNFAKKHNIDLEDAKLVAHEMVMNAAGLSSDEDKPAAVPERHARDLIVASTNEGGLLIIATDTEHGIHQNPERPMTHDPKPVAPEAAAVPLPRVARDEAIAELETTGRGLKIARALGKLYIEADTDGKAIAVELKAA